MEVSDYQARVKRTLKDDPGKSFSEYEFSVISDILDTASNFGLGVDILKKWIFHQHPLTLEDFEAAKTYINEAASCLENLRLSLDISMSYKPSGVSNLMDSASVMKAWNLVGLIGETGEIIEAKGDPVKMKKELGDGSWYIFALAIKYGLSMDDVLELNDSRLKERYPDGFDTEKSINRVS